jgi:two-component system, OmpR family, phosphate regulon response regulator PhoB
VAKIVAIDADPRARDEIATALGREGHEVRTAATAAAGLAALSAVNPDLVLMELTLPDIDGNELLRSIRRTGETRGIAVMVVTQRTDEIDRVVAFELGADDCVTKPFSTRELGLRVRAVLRRRAGSAGERGPGTGRVRVDPVAHRVWVDGREVALSLLELRILIALSERRAAVRTREDLLHVVWGAESGVSLRSVDAYVKRLRKKLGAARYCIETVRGVGYRLSAGAP